MLIVDRSLLGLAEAFIGDVASLEHVLVVGESYDEAVAGAAAGFEWPELDERAAAIDVLHERHDRRRRRASSTAIARRICTASRSRLRRVAR